ncbi:uncharacterized protein LOC144494207 isoform X1 [Mustelus asterias]
MLFKLLFFTLGCFSQAQRISNKDDAQELPSPTISIDPKDGSFGEGSSARIECRTPSYHAGSMFYLMQEGKDMPIVEETVPDGEETATFELHNLTAQHEGEYRCFYRNKKSGQWKDSSLSDPVHLTMHGMKNKWIWIPTGAGVVVLIVIVIVTVWCICKKKAESRRRKNDGSNLWTFDSNIGSPSTMNNRQSFRFSRGLEPEAQEDGGSAYFANHSTEFLNDTELTSRRSQKKPYFITFIEQ